MTRLLSLLTALTAGLALAQSVPTRISFSARLTDTTGAPVTGAHALTFSLHDAATGGAALWTESLPSAAFSSDGVTTTELGASTPLTPTVLDGRRLFLEIAVDGTTMSPRLAIASVPYAIRASVAASAESVGSLTESSIQRRVAGSCSTGQAVRSIDAMGAVECEPIMSGGNGDITGVTTAAGSGLTGGASSGDASLSLLPCGTGEVLKHDGTGWGCATDSTGTPVVAGTGLSASGNTLSVDFAAIDARLSVGRLPTNPGRSCLDIKTRNPSAADGIYLVDIDGNATASAPPFSVYCDMTRDGGGWTLVLRTWYQSGLTGLAGGRGSPLEWNTASRVEPYKLPDATIRAIVGADNNFDLLADQVLHNTAFSAANNEFVIVRNYTGVFSFTSNMPESSTPTVFESYQAHDNALVWRGRLGCGASNGGFGINCEAVLTTPNPVGNPNPAAGAGCTVNLGSGAGSTSWHNLAMGMMNTDTYLYVCSGAQHSSSYANVHRYWVR